MKTCEKLIFHRNPFLKEPLMEECRTLQDPLSLGFFVHGQQYLQIIGIAEIRMVAVCSLDDVQLLGCNADRRSKGEGAAIKGAVSERSPRFQRNQDFLVESFVIHIAANFCKPFGGALLRAEEEIIHVEHIAVVDLSQFCSEGRFAGGAFAVDGNDHHILLCQEFIEFLSNHYHGSRTPVRFIIF